MKQRDFEGIKYFVIDVSYKKRNANSVLLILRILSEGRVGIFTTDLRITERFIRLSQVEPESLRMEKMFNTYRYKFREQMIEWF